MTTNEELAESAHVREVLLQALPNRCCADLGCPYDAADADTLLAKLLPSVAKAWTQGYDRAMQDAHHVLNQRGYLERRGESDDWNPYLVSSPGQSSGANDGE